MLMQYPAQYCAVPPGHCTLVSLTSNLNGLRFNFKVPFSLLVLSGSVTSLQARTSTRALSTWEHDGASSCVCPVEGLCRGPPVVSVCV